MGGVEPKLAWMIVMAVLWLVFLEGLLSADNALVMAMMVRHLSRDLQKRVLYYGLIGALVFRVIAVSTANILLKFWFLQVGGGLYLLYLAGAHFIKGQGDLSEGAAGRRLGGGFWGAVIAVEMADIAFSIDSILAAVAMAKGLPLGPRGQYWIVIIGGFLGIITMRYVASYFILLLERFRGLEPAAYGLVAWIGLKLVVDGLHNSRYSPYEMNSWVFWIGMAAIVAMGFIYRPKSPSTPHDTVELAQEVAWSLSSEFHKPEPEAEDKDSRNTPEPTGEPGPLVRGDSRDYGDDTDRSDEQGESHEPAPPSPGLPTRPGPA